MADEKAVRDINRRGSRRRPPRSTVRVECRKGTLGLGPNVAESFLDVAEGGVRVILKAKVEPKDEMEVLLLGFGMQRPVKACGTVCWVVPLEDGRFCVGLSFQKRLAHRDVQFMALPG